MYERLSNEDVRRALDELIDSIGVKESRPFDDLVTLLRKKDTKSSIQELAAWFGIPVLPSVTCVPKEFVPGRPQSTRFDTSSLAMTDAGGHAVGGITAQVLIPGQLPVYGTSDIEGFTIEVRVSENCHEYPETFVTVMAHELSHVLLASLRHPSQDSELHAELVPIVFGLGTVLRKGRKTVEITMEGSTTNTITTTYGYLTDSQFSFACRYVSRVLSRYLSQKRDLLQTVAQTRSRLDLVSRELNVFHDYLQHLDLHRPTRVQTTDAIKLVQLHAPSYDLEWKTQVADARAKIDAADSFARDVTRYPPPVVIQLQKHSATLASVLTKLTRIREAIAADVATVRKYSSLSYRIGRALR